MSLLVEPPFEEAKARDPRYQRLFDCLDIFQCDLFDLFDSRVAERGFEAAFSGQVSKISIMHCSPNELRISGTVKQRGNWVVSCLMSVAGGDTDDVELDLQCSCGDDDRCEHASAILESFFDSGWVATLNDFIARVASGHDALLGGPAQGTPIGVHATTPGTAPLSVEMRRRLARVSEAQTPLPPRTMAPRYQVGYQLRCEQGAGKSQLKDWYISAVAVTPSEEGQRSMAYCSEDFESISCTGGVAFSPEDGPLLIGLQALSVRQPSRWGASGSFGRTTLTTRGDLLLKAVALGRCFLPNSRVPLELGAPLVVQQGWRTTAKGYREAAILGVSDGVELLNAQPAPLYLSVKSGVVGSVVVDGAAIPMPVWLGLPRVKLEQSISLLETLRSLGLPTEGLAQAMTEGVVPSLAIPRVKVAAVVATDYANHWGAGVGFRASERPEIIRLGKDASKVYAFRLSFQYGETEVTGLDPIMSISDPKSPGGQLLRNLAFERSAGQMLQQLGLKPFHTLPYARHSSPRGLFGVHSYDVDYYVALLRCVKELVVRAEANGWDLEIPPELTPIVVQPSELRGGIVEGQDSDWFEARLDIEAQGQTFDLGAVLVSLLGGHPSRLEQFMRSSAERVVIMADDRSIDIEHERLARLLKVVQELADPEERKILRFNRLSGYALENALADSFGRWESSHQIRSLRERIARLEQPTALSEPEGFSGSLRDYQQHGLAWLSTLAEAELGGILADDMGLGKTIQLIAWMLHERSLGRDEPTLVVCPKSVVPNWRAELARFAPTLSVYQATGVERTKSLEELKAANVIITSYAILHRDCALFREISFNVAIFDEAQAIKNPVTVSYQAAQAIKARMKIPVSGTPLENNLQDLWAHCNLTLPGFLYSRRSFAEIYRKPIEKEGNAEVREHLAKRIKPFVMRRTKQEVVKELPPLSEITKKCQLEGTQRDLYEAIRQLTTKKVREALASKGAKRSHIEFLDALLKLRQVCCDPRLVKTKSVKGVLKSAKLELLMEFLPTLLEEGRSVVIFSQFTSMLSLIEREVTERLIPFCLLTGETKDRETSVQAFQAGEVRLFLMSLKAGGVGINLTRADTVILYDPWWNPAVEAQAICRAHRIGQSNPVFAYRLIAQGTIEEKIQELQVRKRALVENLLAENERPPELSEELVDFLFAPIDG